MHPELPIHRPRDEWHLTNSKKTRRLSPREEVLGLGISPHQSRRLTNPTNAFRANIVTDGEWRMCSLDLDNHRYNSNMPRKFQFIAVSDPTEPISSESRKLTNSHVIRQRHAKERRLRTQSYQRALPRVQEEQDAMLSRWHVSKSLTGVLDYSRDPFSALPKPLSSQDYFLLHHCTLDVLVICSNPQKPEGTGLGIVTPYYLIDAVPLTNLQMFTWLCRKVSPTAPCSTIHTTTWHRS